MSRKHPATTALQRFGGVLRSPRATLAGVVAEPVWADMLALLVAVMAIPLAILLSTELGQQAALDYVVRQLENFGVVVDDGLYARLDGHSRSFRWYALAAVVGGVPLAAFALAAAVCLVFRLAGDRRASFTQALAVAVHTGVVPAFQRLLGLPMSLVTESMSMPSNPAVLLPMLDESSYFAAFLGAIDLFTVWWLVVLAIGLAALYRRPARTLALRLVLTYALIAAVMAAVITTLRIA